MPKYPMSDGTMIDKKAIDRKVSKAKEDYIENFKDEHGYLFCERSNRSDLPLERSHIISVRKCQDYSKSELAWCEYNLELLTQENHRKTENWANDKRKEWYYYRKHILEMNLKPDLEVLKEFEEYYNSMV